MFEINPFAAVAGALPANAMQVFVVLMALAVLLGTVLDMIHKGSAAYFFANWRKSRGQGAQVDVASIAVKTVVVDVLASGEFCNPRRRIAHLLTMYGFILYLVTTAIMVFGYPSVATPTPALVVQLWWLGGLMVLVGGYWFWFFIRVDVAAEGHSPLRFVRADLFIVSLVLSVTFGLIWAYAQARGGGVWANIFLALYLIATTVLFGSIPWSKFSHMFFKPAAAFQKRVEQANGTRRNLPAPADKPATFGSARQAPHHY